ncbi:hypothetical protein ACTFIU_001361 [Dictyostelium citrinum]
MTIIVTLIRLCDTRTRLDTFTIESNSISNQELVSNSKNSKNRKNNNKVEDNNNGLIEGLINAFNNQAFFYALDIIRDVLGGVDFKLKVSKEKIIEISTNAKKSINKLTQALFQQSS